MRNLSGSNLCRIIFLMVFLFLPAISCKKEETEIEETSEVEAIPGGADFAMQDVLVEVDSMEGVPFPPTEAELPQSLSLKDIYSTVGINLNVVNHQSNLKADRSLTLADLHGLLANENLPAPTSDTWKLYGLMATKFGDDPATRGLMFTPDSRNAFVVFYDTIKAWEKKAKLKDFIPAEYIRIMAHEIAHCFNVHHPDFEGSEFRSGSSLESSSRANSVKWQFSPMTISHFLHHDRAEIEPGKQVFGSILESHKASHKPTTETFTVFRPDISPVPSTLSATEEIPVREILPVTPNGSPLRFELAVPKAEYAFREPIIVFATVKNESSSAVELPGPIGLEYRFMNLDIQRPGSDQWMPFVPAYLLESESLTLPPGEELTSPWKIFYGVRGWTFDEPGHYRLRASFPDQRWSAEIQVFADIHVAQPRPEYAKVEKLINGKEQALYLLFNGGDHLASGKQKLEEIAMELQGSPHAAYARVALGLGALTPSVNPETGVRPRERLAAAKVYILDPLNDELPDEILTRVQTQLGVRLAAVGQMEEVAKIKKMILLRNIDNSRVVNLMRRSGGLQELFTDQRQRYPG